MSAARDLGRDLLHLWTAPPWQEGLGSWSDDDRLQTSIRRHLVDGAPKWEIRSHSPRQMVGLEGHCKSQGLSVPVRSVSPFSDPSSNLAQPSRSGAIRLATGQHGPDDPSVLVGDRDRRAVITAPLAKLVDPHTSRVGFSHCRADNCAHHEREASSSADCHAL
jgi:hypothetical protein